MLRGITHPLREPPNSSMDSTEGTELPGKWEVQGDPADESIPIDSPKSPSALTANALYPQVRGPGREAAEEALCLLVKTYESLDHNFSIVMFSLKEHDPPRNAASAWVWPKHRMQR